MAEEEKIDKQKPKVKKHTVDKWKRKLWYTILAPPEFDRKELGRTMATKPESVKDRVVGVSARDISNQSRRQYVTLHFKVTEVVGDKAHTKVVGHEIKEIHIKRVIRRRNSKIEVVQDVAASDGIKLRVKTVVITGVKATAPQRARIWNIVKAAVAEFCKGKDSQNLIAELVFGNLPNAIISDARKICPIKRVEVVKSATRSR